MKRASRRSTYKDLSHKRGSWEACNSAGTPQNDDPKYNWVFKRLFQGPTDAVGAFAYVLYKEDKIAWLEKIGREPTDVEWATFHSATCTPSALQGYRHRAEKLNDEYLLLTLAQRIEQIEEKVKEGAIGSKIDRVLDRLNEEKGFRGWFRDVSGNVVVNIVTVIVIGAIAIGTNVLNRITEWTEKAIAEQPAQQNGTAHTSTSSSNTQPDGGATPGK